MEKNLIQINQPLDEFSHRVEAIEERYKKGKKCFGKTKNEQLIKQELINIE